VDGANILALQVDLLEAQQEVVEMVVVMLVTQTIHIQLTPTIIHKHPMNMVLVLQATPVIPFMVFPLMGMYIALPLQAILLTHLMLLRIVVYRVLLEVLLEMLIILSQLGIDLEISLTPLLVGLKMLFVCGGEH
tara:strand:- start:208 stop:609 length:402 start_codon:yes stop_codon:yes gene_type:complete